MTKLWRTDYSGAIRDGKYPRTDTHHVWLCVDTATGEVTDVVRNVYDQYELVDGAEWRRASVVVGDHPLEECRDD